MKVLYFHQYFTTPLGSSGNRSYKNAVALINLGHQVTIVCAHDKRGNTGLVGKFVNGIRTGNVDGILIIEYDLKYSNKLTFLKRSLLFTKFAIFSAEIAIKSQFDIVICTSTPLSISFPGLISKIFRRKKFIFEVRDCWPDLPIAMGIVKNPLLKILLKLYEYISYHTADKLIGLSPGIVDTISSRGIDRHRIAMIPNGCDLDIFQQTRANLSEQKTNDNKFTAIFAGAHGKANGLQAVLNAALVLIEKKINDIQIILVGDGMEKEALLNFAVCNNLHNVTFMDPLPKKDLSKLFHVCHIGLQILADYPAFYYGTSPNKFFDYIASGLPVITNYPGWISDLIKEHNCGYSVHPNDAEALADVLIDASSHQNKLEIMRTNSLQLAKSHFDRARLASDFVDWVSK